MEESDVGCGFRMPTQNTSARSTCFCGVEITNNSSIAHIRERHMEQW
jgi:hypothetical protein